MKQLYYAYMLLFNAILYKSKNRIWAKYMFRRMNYRVKWKKYRAVMIDWNHGA